MLRWRKVSTVIRREYLSRVRTKAFWITTLALPVIILVFTVLPSLLMRRAGGEHTIALVTADATLAKTVQDQLPASGDARSGDEGTFTIRIVHLAPEGDAAAVRTRLKRDVLAKRYSAALVVPETVYTDGKLELLTTNTSAFQLMSKLERAVGRAVTRLRLERAGVPADKVADLTRAVDLQPVRIGKGGSENAEGFLQSFFLSYALMFLLWMSVMIYGMQVMRGVLEEKSSRIVEVVVANLSAKELMAGKIMGVGAVGLTQYAIWTLVLVNLAVPGLITMAGFTGAVISPWLLVFFVLFFVLGYVLYSTFYAALGAAFNSEEEAQQMQSVAGWVIAIPFVFMFPVMNNPDSTLSVALSLFPPFAPVLFFLRMSVQFPPTWQIVLCLVLLLGTIVAVARVAAAIYRVGILMYGKRPTFREVMHWVKES